MCAAGTEGPTASGMNSVVIAVSVATKHKHSEGLNQEGAATESTVVRNNGHLHVPTMQTYASSSLFASPRSKNVFVG